MTNDLNEDLRRLALEYALGTLAPEERARFALALEGDEELREELARHMETVAEWEEAAGAAPSEVDLLPRVLARIRADKLDVRHLPDLDTVAWSPSSTPSVDYHWLREPNEEGASVVLLRGVPGARYPDHDHPIGERGFVLQGTLADHRGVHPAGSFLRFDPGSRHEEIRVEGDEPCIVLVVTGRLEVPVRELIGTL